MSQNLDERIRILTITDGAITTNASQTSKTLVRETKGVVLCDIRSKNNNDNTMTLTVETSGDGGTTWIVVGTFTIASGAAARLAPLKVSGLAPYGLIKTKSASIAGTSPNISTLVTLIGFKPTRAPQTHAYI